MTQNFQMNSFLGQYFGNTTLQGHEQMQKEAAAKDAEAILGAIRSGQIDVNQLTDEEATKLAHIVQAGTQPDPTEALLQDTLARDPLFFERHKLAGQIVAHSQWQELQNINQEQEKIAAVNALQQRAEILKQASPADLLGAIQSGRLNINDLTNEEGAYVLKKLATGPFQMGADGSIPLNLTTADFRSAGSTLPLGAEDIVHTGAGGASPQEQQALLARLKAMGAGALETAQDYGGRAWEGAKHYGGQAANFVDQQAMALGNRMGADSDAMRRLAGYGAPVAALGALGAGAYGLSQMGGGGEKQASAHDNQVIAMLQQQITELQQQVKTAAPQQQQLQKEFDQEVIKTAQAMLTLNGIQTEQTKFNPQNVTEAAKALLRQNGWQA